MIINMNNGFYMIKININSFNFNILFYILNIYKLLAEKQYKNWEWVLGIGDCSNLHSPIPNPQSPFYFILILVL